MARGGTMGHLDGNETLRLAIEHFIRNRLLVWMYRSRNLGMSRYTSRVLFSSIEKSLVKAKLLR